MSKTNRYKDKNFPPLPLSEWEETKMTLHLYVQIIGKIRLALYPFINHWWHAALYVSPNGLTTQAVPYNYGSFEIALDLFHHQLIITTSGGTQRAFPLSNGLSVSEFYKNLIDNLYALNIHVKIRAVPYGLSTQEPFATDTTHASYNKEHIEKFRQILIGVNGIFEEFRGWFTGKSTPVHLFWHSFDLALTRFSGKPAPRREGAGKVDQEAYSHEVISFGFWWGDDDIPEPAFYSYTSPEPEGLIKEPLVPKEAYWGSIRGGAIALLMYNEVRKSGSPRDMVLEFLESAYQAGANRAGWDKSQFLAKASVKTG